MTQLLVSVRDGAEAFAALQGGAAIIDVKEPRQGPLGAASQQQLAEVAAAVAGRVRLSAALGELLDTPPVARVLDVPGYSLVKVGMAGCARVSDWCQRWSAFVAQVPSNISVVAVVYADHVAAQAPTAREVIDAAERLGISYLLVDTFDKSSGHLLTHHSLDELRQIVSWARERAMTVSLAGSLTRRLLPTVLLLSPDFVAVRGAACRDGRVGQVDEQLVRQIARQLSTPRSREVKTSRDEFVDSDVGES